MRQTIKKGHRYSVGDGDYDGVVGDERFEKDFETWCDRNDGDFKKYSNEAYECQFQGGNLKAKQGYLDATTRRKSWMTNSDGRYTLEGDELVVESQSDRWVWDAHELTLQWE